MSYPLRAFCLLWMVATFAAGCDVAAPEPLPLLGSRAMTSTVICPKGPPHCETMPGAPTLTRGTFDALDGRRYLFFPVLDMPGPAPSEAAEAGVAPPRIERAMVRLDLGDDLQRAVDPPPVITHSFEQGVPLETLQKQGFALIPPDVATRLRQTLSKRHDRLIAVWHTIARVRMKGVDSGGRLMVTKELSYPISLCYGCLRRLPVAVGGILPNTREPPSDAVACEAGNDRLGGPAMTCIRADDGAEHSLYP